MAESIVDALEIVEIEQQHRQRRPALQQPLENAQNAGAVVDAGQAVEGRQMFEPTLQRLALADVAPDAFDPGVLALLVAQGLGADGDVDDHPVLAPHAARKIVHRTVLANLGHQGVALRQIGIEGRSGQADDFLGGVAQHVLHRRADVAGNALRIGAVEHILHGVHHALEIFVGLAQALLHRGALGHVEKARQHRAFIVHHHDGAAHGQHQRLAVAGVGANFSDRVDAAALGVTQPRQRAVQIERVNENIDLMPDDVGRLARPQQPQRRGVGVTHGIAHQHRYTGRQLVDPFCAGATRLVGVSHDELQAPDA